jgi:hypothetical protein
MTYTYATLEISPAAYNEIYGKLQNAGYEHAFDNDNLIDMHGIALKKGKESDLGYVNCSLKSTEISDNLREQFMLLTQQPVVPK